MSAKGVGRMNIMKGIINAQLYFDEILKKKVKQSAIDIFGQDLNGPVDFIFQQDGAPCHTAKVCQA